MADNGVTFDYIVVGSGSAGSVVAARLAEAPGAPSVLLLEAGGPSISASGGQNFFALTKQNSEEGKPALTLFDVPIQWWYVAYHRETGFLWDITDQGFLGAKLLGGLGAVNAMAWLRGVEEDFKDWNVNDWDYNSNLPFYIKSETNIGKHTSGSLVHGKSGPITVSDPVFLDVEGQVFIDTALRAGYHLTYDFNDGNDRSQAIGRFQWNIKNGQRDSPYGAYIANKPRPNLTVRTNAQVVKVVFEEGQVPRAVGVDYVTPAGNYVAVRARKEVVLSAGAVNTPKILILSGVGPKAQLEKFGIKKVVELEGVGKNCHDHLGLDMVWDNPKINYPTPVQMDIPQQAYLETQNGQWATSGWTTAAFTKLRNDGKKRPDVEFALFPRSVGGKPDDPQGSSVRVIVMNVEARGEVTLKSGDYRDPPSISKISGQREHDTQMLIDAVVEFRRIASQEPYHSHFGPERYPGSEVQTPEQLREYVIETESGVGHWAGTTKMGNDLSSPDVVVDNHLRVKGVRGLRVADASIIPKLTNAHCHATIIMIGERAADFILKDSQEAKLLQSAF